jgi:hypothetical protein
MLRRGDPGDMFPYHHRLSEYRGDKRNIPNGCYHNILLFGAFGVAWLGSISFLLVDIVPWLYPAEINQFSRIPYSRSCRLNCDELDHEDRMEVLYHLYPVQLCVYANYLLLPRDGESNVGGLGFAV